MAGGYMGKMLFVDLSTGEIKEEPLDENICRNFIGGNGIGARMLYSLQKMRRRPSGTGKYAGDTDRAFHRHDGTPGLTLHGRG